MEACLRRYPQLTTDLAPLLHLALESKRTLDFTPAAAAKVRARLLLQSAIARQKIRRERRWHWPRLPRMTGAPRWAMSAAAVVVFMAVGGSGIVAASNKSMPDQTLYPVKRAVEEARLVFTFSNDSKAQLYARFADRRVREIAFLSEKGKAQRVESLTADLDRNLRHVQRSIAPEAIPVRPFELLKEQASQEPRLPAPIVPGVATSVGVTDGVRQPSRLRQLQPGGGEDIAKPGPQSRRAMPMKLAIRRELVAGFKRQDEALQLAMAEAEGPTKQPLRRALHVLWEHRKAFLVAIDEELPTPTDQARP